MVEKKMFPINRSLNFTIKSRKVTPASGLQMSINLGISGMICMHASQGQGIANLALKPNLLGNLGKNHGKTSGYGSFCVQPYLQMDGLLQQTTYVLDPLVRLVQYPSINAGFSTKITQIGKKMEKKNHRIWGIRNNLTCRGKIHDFQIFPVKMFNHRIHILGATP